MPPDVTIAELPDVTDEVVATDKTPELTNKLSPTIIPPSEEVVASGRMYLLAPVSIPSNLVLSVADIKPADDVDASGNSLISTDISLEEPVISIPLPAV
jgi:hypothetical protein